MGQNQRQRKVPRNQPGSHPNPNAIALVFLILRSVLPMALSTNLLVFREVGEQISGPGLFLRLREAVLTMKVGQPDSVLTALIVAGELECSLADSASRSVTQAASITDALA